MKRSIFLLIALCSCSFAKDKNKNEPDPKETTQQKKIGNKEILDHAKYWASELPKLTDEELSLLANYLYFDCLTNYAESTARSLLISIHNLSIIMNKQLVTDEQEAGKTALFNAKQLEQLKKEILPMRRHAIGSFQACIKDIEQSELRTVKEIIINLQSYRKAVCEQIIKQDKETIIKTGEVGLKALETHIEKLNDQKELLEKVLKNENPYIKEGADPDIANFEMSVYLSDLILASLNEITLPATAMKQMSCDALNINLFISKSFYNNLLESLPKSKKSKLTALYCKDGRIDDEDEQEPLVPFDEEFKLDKKYFLP